MNTLVLAHYYTPKEVKQVAHFAGDSLELSLLARNSNAERIVFAGVRFMAETAKLLNPAAEVILPNKEATCSLVTQVENKPNPELYRYLSTLDSNVKVITYINSSVRLKSLSDIIVTSANVEEIVTSEINKGNKVFFTPDRNMGAYLKETNPEWGDNFDYWRGAVCEVHDLFSEEQLSRLMNGWTDGKKYLIAHPESSLPILRNADMVGSTSKMLKWIEGFSDKYATIYVATEEGLLHNMRVMRPELDIKQAPTYRGCQCNSCPYMKRNTLLAVDAAIAGIGGEVIEIDNNLKEKALMAIENGLTYEFK